MNKHPNPNKLKRVRHRGQTLLLSVAEIETGLARAREAASRIATLDPATQLTIGQVLAALNIRKSRLYQVIDTGRFPRPTIVYGPGRGQKVACWPASAVTDWLRNRQLTT